MLQVALRHGTSVDYDKVSALLADKPLLALEAIRLGREVGYVKPTDLLILGYLRAMDEDFSRRDVEHDLQLYDFLKKKLAQYEGDIVAIQQQINSQFEKFRTAALKRRGSSTSGITSQKKPSRWTVRIQNLRTFEAPDLGWKKICKRWKESSRKI